MSVDVSFIVVYRQQYFIRSSMSVLLLFTVAKQQYFIRSSMSVLLLFTATKQQ